MPPVGVGASRFASALETGEAKLWVLLIGVNQYQDDALPPLRYAALDCQGLGEALSEATQPFPQKEFLIHHDLISEKPTLATIQGSLQRLVREAKPKDTVLTYFSGHGIVDAASGQTVLCVSDTQKQNALQTGLGLQEMLQMLGECDAHSQIVWLDACHSGNITLSGAKGSGAKGQSTDPALLNPTPHLLELLRQRAAKSRGFYALLSCDQGQQSWEFPDLGHGVFSYYLMRGLRGEAAGPHGIIDADGLYRYVYYQTLQYVEQTNQQLRLVNQQKRNKGDTHFHSEYSLQTPKRIVEGVGETILGLKPHMTHIWQKRQALLIDGLMEQSLDSESPPSLTEPILRSLVTPIAEVLQSDGNFELECFSPSNYPAIADPWLEVRNVILRFLQSDPASLEPRLSPVQQVATRLLYLRGSIVTSEEGDSWLVLGNGVKISRAWLRQELRRSRVAQQVVILDCPGAVGLEDWLDDLKMESDYGQCILACASPTDDPELFAQVLLEALIAANPQTGLPIATLLAKLQTNLDGLGLTCHLWLSGTQGLIEVLPSTSGNSPSASTPSISTQPMPAISATSNCKENSLQFPQEVIVSVLSEQVSGTPTAISAPIVLEPIQDDPVLTDLKHRLLPVLLPLVGPVAPTLIAQASAIANHAHGLIETISQLLPASKCAAFERQAQALVQTRVDRPEETPPRQVVPDLSEPPTTLHQSAPGAEGLSVQHLAVAKQVLLELVGPITSVLLNQIPPETNSVAALVSVLSSHLSAQQCAILEQRLSLISPVPARTDKQSALPNAEEVCLAESVESAKLDQVSTGSGRGVSTSNSGAINETFIQTCEYELTRIVGPIAKWMVNGQRGEISKMSSVAFVETLAANIPNDQKAAEFRQRLLNVKF